MKLPNSEFSTPHHHTHFVFSEQTPILNGTLPEGKFTNESKIVLGPCEESVDDARSSMAAFDLKILRRLAKFTLPILLAIFLIPFVFSQTGIDKINEYNRQQANNYLENLSFIVAFVGGMISVLLPCTLAILPAFFA